VEKGLINIWSVMPLQDPFWIGDLAELSRLVSLLGLKPNVIFGPGNGISAVNKVPKAQYNLLVSPWLGLNTVQLLKETFGTPYIHYPCLPIGPTETGKFLTSLAEAAGVPKAKVRRVIDQQEEQYYFYIERAADILLERRLMPKHFVTIADSFYTLGISRFLINDMSMLPHSQFITDDPPKEYRPAIAEEFKNFGDGISVDVTFTNDGGAVREKLRSDTFRGRPLVLGSGWDRVVTREIKGYPLSVATPVSDRMVLNRFYAGYNGALRLTEDIYSVILGSFQ
jgi:nitrogenase molybdenum-iron protein beta chain